MNRNSWHVRTALVLLSVLLGAGTSAGSQQGDAVYDSSGIRVVALPTEGPPPGTDTTIELYRTLGEFDLYRVSGAVFLPDGGLAIANGGAHEIIFLDPEGEPVRRYAAMEDRIAVLRRSDFDEEYLVVFRIDATRNSMETP